MTGLNRRDAKSLILACLQDSLGEMGLAPDTISDGWDLLATGLLDSLGFLRLIAELEFRLQFPLDLGDMDPEQLTVIGSLAAHIAERCAAGGQMARAVERLD